MNKPENSLEERLEDIPETYGPGRVLKAKRKEYEWAIESVAQALHLSTTNIRALEEDRYDQLPGSTYVIGYWRSYARLLNIDLDETIEANKRNLQVVQPKATGLSVDGGPMPRGDSRKGLVWLALSALILAGLALAWKSGVLDPKKILNVAQFQEQNESTQLVAIAEEDEAGVLRKVEEELISKLSNSSQSVELITDSISLSQDETIDETQTVNTAAVASSAITTAEPSAEAEEVNASDESLVVADDGLVNQAELQTAAVTADKNLLVMNLEKDSWLDVRDKSNKRLIYRSGKAGESIELQGEPPFYVYIGTPDSVNITYLNQKVPFKAHQSGLFARFKLGEVLENL